MAWSKSELRENSFRAGSGREKFVKFIEKSAELMLTRNVQERFNFIRDQTWLRDGIFWDREIGIFSLDRVSRQKATSKWQIPKNTFFNFFIRNFRLSKLWQRILDKDTSPWLLLWNKITKKLKFMGKFHIMCPKDLHWLRNVILFNEPLWCNVEPFGG